MLPSSVHIGCGLDADMRCRRCRAYLGSSYFGDMVKGQQGMDKQVRFTDISDICSKQRAIIERARDVVITIRSLFDNDTFSALSSLRFSRTVTEPVFNEQLNFVEYLNQTFTYLVCLYAARSILREWPDKEVVVNFGTQAGFDVMTIDGSVICECFAATTVKSNDKLKKDVIRVNGDAKAQTKCVYFYDQSEANDKGYIQRLKENYPGVLIQGIPLNALIEPLE